MAEITLDRVAELEAKARLHEDGATTPAGCLALAVLELAAALKAAPTAETVEAAVTLAVKLERERAASAARATPVLFGEQTTFLNVPAETVAEERADGGGQS